MQCNAAHFPRLLYHKMIIAVKRTASELLGRRRQLHRAKTRWTQQRTAAFQNVRHLDCGPVQFRIIWIKDTLISPRKICIFIFNWFLKRSVQEASFRVQPFKKPFDVSDLRKSLELAADYCMETLLQDIKLSCNTSGASAALFPKSGGRDWTLRIVIIFHAFMFMWEVVISRRQRVRTIAGHRCLPRKTKHRFSLNHFVFSQSPSAWQHGLSRAKLVYGGVQKVAKQYCSFVWLFWHTVAPAGAERLSCLGRSRFAVMLPAHFLLRACLFSMEDSMALVYSSAKLDQHL